MSNEISLDRAKLKALVHYVCSRAPSPKLLGATKLNKILFYADISVYLSSGKPITGEEYVKHQYGPVSTHLDEVLAELESEGALAISAARGQSVYAGESYLQYLFLSLTPPDLSRFTAEEISTVDQLVEKICHRHSARSISDLSHDAVWRAAEIGEPLPYHTAFVHTLGEVTAEDVAWAKEVLGAA